MIIKRWIGEPADCIPGLSQELMPTDRPYAPDWIVETVKWDTANRRYWLTGHRPDGSTWIWGHYADRVFDWRYDLTHARYEIGRHETETEARRRERAERLATA